MHSRLREAGIGKAESANSKAESRKQKAEITNSNAEMLKAEIGHRLKGEGRV
jgi:hypothetical protein